MLFKVPNASRIMFGKQEWFRTTNSGKLILPVAYQGWCYLAVWGTVILAPFVLFLFLNRIPESIIWVVLASLFSWLDIQKIRHKLNEPDERDLFYIGQEDQESHVKTENFDLHVKE